MNFPLQCIFLQPFSWCAMLIARLPQGFLLFLAKLLCFVGSPLLYRRRRIASININCCFKELSTQERQALFNQNLIATVMGVFELCRAWYAPSQKLKGLADIYGLEHLHAALAEGKGVLLLTGHFTHTELAVRLLGEALQKKLRGVVRRHSHACVEQAFEHARTLVFKKTIAKKDLRGLLTALKEGDAVVYSSDQNFTYQNAFIPFFGVPASSLISTPAIVARSGAKMLALWFYRDHNGRYQITIDAPWPNWPSGDAIADTKCYLEKLEAEVRKHPEQYLWVHRRFKTRPAGSPGFYD
jgi:Kdo2-lipid IVA lauroyltransferase/acyltransferase